MIDMKHKGIIAGLITVFLVTLTTQALVAEEHPSEHQGGHTEHRHHVALFSGNTHSEGEDENLLRLGVIYDWHINSYSVSPVVEVDLVHGKASYVYGISVGRGF
jgi:hypothetical protein